MDIAKILNDLAAGSLQATPATGSAGVDYLTSVPASLIKVIAGFFTAVGV